MRAIKEKEKKPLELQKLYLEVNLLGRPFFVLSRKEGKKLLEKAAKEQHSPIRYEQEISIGDRKLKSVWEVIPAVTLGFAGPFDKKVFTTIQQILIRQLPIKENPVRIGSLYGIAKMMGITDCGKNKARIKESLIRIGSTTIYTENSFYLKSRGEFWRVEGKRGASFHLWDVYWRGDRLPNGEIAECIYLHLHPPFVISLNDYYIKILDNRLYQSLKSPIAQRLYEVLSLKFYGLRDSSYVSFPYPELCQLLPITQQTYLSKAKQILRPAHKELVEKKFLEKVTWRTSKGKWRILYYPGERALAELSNDHALGQAKATKEWWEVQAIVQDILEVTEDEKSRAFYMRVARNCPQEIIYRVLSEVKDEWHRGRVRKSKGALFTDKIKRYCKEYKLDI